MNDFFRQKTVLITGAANGIGKAIALAAADAGARLVLGDVDAEGLAGTAQAVAERGGTAECRACDVRNMAHIEALVASAANRFGHPDAVFANAGTEGALAAPWDYAEEDFSRIIDINLMGVWRLLKVVLPGMVDRGGGSVVAMSSVAGLTGANGLAAYVASKHGVMGLVRSVALAVAKTGVRVNALCPGLVDTAMVGRLAGADPAVKEALLSSTPFGRLGRTGEIAAAALWLASDQASFVTGHGLVVDGGYLAQ